MPRRLRSTTKYKPLKPIFDTPGSELGPLLARMSVLYEDLRLEVNASMAESIPACDRNTAMYRKYYFLRRSTITLVEFRSTIQRLSQDAGFMALKERFTPFQLERWDAANEFFGEFHKLLKNVRNDCGGHFQLETAKAISREHLEDVTGSFEIDFGSTGDEHSIHLGYTNDLVASSFTLRKSKDEELEPFIRVLFQAIREGWNHIVLVMHAISLSTIIPAFGL